MASRVSASYNSTSLTIANKLHSRKARALALAQTSSPSIVASTVVTQLSQALVAAPSFMPKPIPVAEARPKLANEWREIQGSDDWEDLVEPLHPLLRQEIVRYGEFVIACYNAFDLDPSSKRYLSCKYGKSRMLEQVGMDGCGYDVTKYIYATPDIAIPTTQANSSNCESHWIGYIALASDDEVKRLGRRDILVPFRGTVTTSEWIANFMSSLTPARLDPNDPRPEVKVESGFLSLYTSDDSTCKFNHGSCRQQLLSEVSRLVSKYKDEEVSITLAGHSTGSSLAKLLAYDLAELGLNRDGLDREIPITVYSYGGPRVGNSEFKKRCEDLGVKVLRVVNVNDPVTKLPGVFLNEKFRVLAERLELPWSHSCYTHVGVEIVLDFFKMKNPACVHDLGTYIGLLKFPKLVQVAADKDGRSLLSRAKEFLSAENFGILAWQVGNLMQSLGI